MQTLTVNPERTCRSLFNEFNDRYPIIDVETNPKLAKLFTYLQHRCSMANGNYYHEADQDNAALLKEFLQYSPEKQLKKSFNQ